ncbi:2-C-methyl-D-erythritol 4-phosphate cytidylyltransferase [Clostridium tertium]|jgi:2-C-methyl-D-erythritol 4-phosphate cytidylyltransferase|uniref:2-C-methyl-D-erythritol 4-phosphate cytidylyltransferase n=1 Tax=Clostridium TaxID=1485 RepID=UPI00019AFAF0|nr:MULTISPECIES: 2-C-methyl-D-erythritol 4-phosphate cytidylyltransferase [Clostridium]EEH96400.1 2-C-methyl-D-erythritol 4-phosphate cytidylyltransferase [Clostridium sp. 7_2_43FAA]MBS5308640.1 2-C-methyl-D-erythritol 4-phosphate cytidylyltransferase [Clostridium sp.]MBS6503184.1 2-C-methyl-D-erythritol 4-phosphate cytidylyltransferase [Clostridium sp.]MBU6133909.1 2-C-methyl-D-erythritol 4-phosphate cytidylyltransferase [Clostridium tertium]MDB1921245.1 2-C-methyl-D-erythritol 4-phosphate cy
MISAIILAGGKGKRMGAKISKQYIELNGKPILYYTLKRFVDCEGIDKIILVLPKDEIEYCNKEILEKYSLKVDMIVEGGKERQDSVYNALQKINDSEIVLIHDGARAFVSERVIKDGIKYAKIYGAAAPGVMPKDTIKVVDENGFSDSTPDRSKLLAIQTPQTFKLEIIKECHEKVKENNISVTDDTMVVEMYNNKVYLYNGEYTNIKVTTPEDLILAERLI